MKIIIYFESREINIYEVTEQITKSNYKLINIQKNLKINIGGKNEIL